MCVSEEAALELGRDTVLLARVKEWCEAKDHVGVRGEASRLLASLIRHSRSPVSLFSSESWQKFWIKCSSWFAIIPFIDRICMSVSLSGSCQCCSKSRWDSASNLHGNK